MSMKSDSSSNTTLPSALTTILLDFPFPSGIPKEGIRCAAHRMDDLVVCARSKEDQLTIASTLALLAARPAGQSAIIVVRSTAEAQAIYDLLNPPPASSDTLKEEEGIREPLPQQARRHPGKIRIASTFARFKGNCLPSARHCIIITSYTYLLRTLLYRRSADPKLKSKNSLPTVSAYIFLDPLNENWFLKTRGEGYSVKDIDGLLFFFKERAVNHVRKFFVTAGTLPADQQEVIFSVQKVFYGLGTEPVSHDFEESMEEIIAKFQVHRTYALAFFVIF